MIGLMFPMQSSTAVIGKIEEYRRTAKRRDTIGSGVSQMDQPEKSATIALPNIARALKFFMVIVLLAISTANRGYCRETAFFVSPEGSDAHPGTRTQPFKTLEAARDAVRKSDRRQKATVWLRAGVHERRSPFNLTAFRKSGEAGRLPCLARRRSAYGRRYYRNWVEACDR